jgi:hypothetical protein
MTMTKQIILKLEDNYPKDGWEDAEGTTHFNTEFTTPFGPLGNFRAKLDGDEVVILQADEVALFSRKPVKEWPEQQQIGASESINGFGWRIFELKARNGIVRYLLYADEVRFSDEDEPREGLQIGQLHFSAWTPEGPPPARLTNVTTRKVIQEMET